jgi:epoxide hydrolase 4
VYAHWRRLSAVAVSISGDIPEHGWTPDTDEHGYCRAEVERMIGFANMSDEEFGSLPSTGGKFDRARRDLRDEGLRLSRRGGSCCLSGPAGVVSRPSPLPREVLMTTTSLLPDVGIELREGYAEVGDVTLHYVEAGDGPLIVLLHGFPEFWFGWRLQIEPLVSAGFRVVAPDTRGYNLSSKPEGFEAYAVDLLAADIRGLIGELGAESALLVGHDWGGSIAWTTAMNHPEVVDRLVILNAAHPRRLQEGLHSPNQLRKSWYFFFFAVPGLPEDVVHARDWHFFRHFLHEANPPYTPQEIERYVEAWSQRGAAAGMINYYRASVRQSQKEAAAKLRPISAPTLVIWGERDSYLGSDLAEPDRDDVPNLDRVERLPDASHWVHHDEAERVNQLLIDFFAAAAA